MRLGMSLVDTSTVLLHTKRINAMEVVLLVFFLAVRLLGRSIHVGWNLMEAISVFYYPNHFRSSELVFILGNCLAKIFWVHEHYLFMQENGCKIALVVNIQQRYQSEGSIFNRVTVRV